MGWRDEDMKARTELLLYQLTWTLDKLSRPTWRNLDSSFESWAYSQGLLRQIQRLEAQRFIETQQEGRGLKRVVRLTEKGLAAAVCGPDPVARWGRKWDGRWRMVLFDLPEAERRVRDQLRRKLFFAGFGRAQRSAWVSPDPMEALAQELRRTAVDVGGLMLMEMTPCGGEQAADIVAAAWDFEAINAGWQELADHLEQVPKTGGDSKGRDHFVRWARKEHRLLKHCLAVDPLLPEVLLPKGYAGKGVWEKRRKILAKLARTTAPGA